MGSVDTEDFAIYNTYIFDDSGNVVRSNQDGIRLIAREGDFGKFRRIDWDNLVIYFYSLYFQSLNKPRQITAKFNLSKLDVIGFDPMKLIYIEKFNSNFIVEKITNFIPGELTQVKLLKYGD